MLRERIDGWVDPAVAFVRLFGTERHAFWLDAGTDATRGRSRMGAAGSGASVLLATASADGSGEVLRLDPRTGRRDREPGDLFDAVRASTGTGTGAGRGESGALWVGWLGYEFGAAAVGAPVAVRDATAAPDAAWMRADRFVEFDHARRIVTACASSAGSTDADAVAWAARTVRVLSGLVGRVSETHGRAASEPPPVTWRHDAAAYLAMIEACLRRITAGDAYQLCLTNTATIRAAVDPVRTYLALRRSSPTANGGLLRFGDWSLASASPEQFLLVDTDARATTRPIKGTRARGATAEEDERLREELAADEKERAENLMIVDLMRNDLGRVARLGSVEVTELLAVESYRQVHQLVSTVTARLAVGVDALDVVRACFPAGSMTGAPKLAAMRIVAGLEHGPRGPYAGCFGMIADDGSLDLAMTIRSIVIGRDGVTIGSGGGITALSDPAFELAEVALKARAPIAAVYEGIL